MLIRVDIATGKILWTYPWKDEWLENIITPTRFGDLLIFSGVRRGTVALRITAKGPEPACTNPEAAFFYRSTPVLDGMNLYGFGSRKKGQFLCLDARTGKLLWATQGRKAMNAPSCPPASLGHGLTSPAEGPLKGKEAFISFWQRFRSAIPDIHITVGQCITRNGDRQKSAEPNAEYNHGTDSRGIVRSGRRRRYIERRKGMTDLLNCRGKGNRCRHGLWSPVELISQADQKRKGHEELHRCRQPKPISHRRPIGA